MKRLITVVLLLVCCSGCVRKVDIWGLKMEFAEGLDFHAGANGIDRVDDRRGVSPGVSSSKGQ